MDVEFSATIIASVTAIVVALIAAITASKRLTANLLQKINDKINNIEKTLAAQNIKTDCLWEIYGTDVIRSARNSGMISSQSMEVPTTKWVNLISESLVKKIQTQATESSRVLNSPYDVFIEVWQCYKVDLIEVSRHNKTSMAIIYGGVLQICENAVNERE